MTPEDLERRRLRAAEFFRKGRTQGEVAKQLGVSRTAVHYWHEAWKKDGNGGLLRKPPGVESRLSPQDMKKIEKALLKGPKLLGWDTDLWTLPRITQAIKKIAGVSYQDRSVWHVLVRLGWTCQKPERRARERDEKAIERWRKMEWPAIKKGGSAAA